MSGASLANLNDRALNAEGLTVGQDMFCRDEFTADGAIHLAVARISGVLTWATRTWPIPADGPHLDGTDSPAGPALRQQPDGTVNLANAQVGEFRDEPATWPAELHLRGFTYDVLGSRVSTRHRLDWLSRAPGGYVPQLYDQLATHLPASRRRAGRPHGRHREAAPPPPRIQPAQLAVVPHRRLRVPSLAGWRVGDRAGSRSAPAVFSHAYPAHMIAISSHPPTFHPAAYALDLLLPVVGLGQKSAWQPQGSALSVLVLGADRRGLGTDYRGGRRADRHPQT